MISLAAKVCCFADECPIKCRLKDIPGNCAIYLLAEQYGLRTALSISMGRADDLAKRYLAKWFGLTKSAEQN